MPITEQPTPGEPLTMEDMDVLFEAVRERQKKEPGEPAGLSFWVAFQLIGERFRNVECTEGEWKGMKQDVPPFGKGEPKCPNGHDLVQGDGVFIGWVASPITVPEPEE